MSGSNMLCWHSGVHPTLTNGLINKRDPDYGQIWWGWWWMVVIAFHPRLHTVKYDEVDDVGKSVKKLSKIRRIVKKSEKLQRPKKLQKSLVRRNVYRSTNLPSIRYKELKLPLEFWQFFRTLFAGTRRSSLDTTLESIIDKAKLIELLMLCHVVLEWEEVL